MGDYRPRSGDRVRLVIEGEVSAARSDGTAFNIGAEHGNDFNRIFTDAPHIISVEKIEPAMAVFKPGDVVRHRATGERYSIGDAGYLSHQTREFYKWSPVGLTQKTHFTSHYYELVDLSK